MKKNRTVNMVIEDKPYVPLYQQIQDKLSVAKDGLTASELYEKLEASPRSIREIIKRLKDDGLISFNHCRCGHSPVYYLK